MTAVPSPLRLVCLLACLLAASALALDWQRLQPGPRISPRQAFAELLAFVHEAEGSSAQSSAASPGAPGDAAPASPDALHVLFVGNGLTTANNLPGMVAELARAAQERRPLVWRVSNIGNKLRDQMADGNAVKLLHQTRWDAVVVQEHGALTGLRAKGREQWVMPYVRELHAAIAQAGARTVLFVTYARCNGDEEWPDDSYEAMQTRVIEGYRAMADELHAERVPVGAIWRELYYARPDLHLWANDGMMPSTAGSYLAACAFYTHFYGKSPVGLAYVAGLEPQDAAEIQRAVERAMLPAR